MRTTLRATCRRPRSGPSWISCRKSCKTPADQVLTANAYAALGRRSLVNDVGGYAESYRHFLNARRLIARSANDSRVQAVSMGSEVQRSPIHANPLNSGARRYQNLVGATADAITDSRAWQAMPA